MFKKITRTQLGKFLAKHTVDAPVLDLGSGGSSYDRFFPNRLTVDIDSARKPDIVADAHNLPFNDEEYSYILCTEMLEHVKDPFQVEREIRRVMKNGGKLILTTRFVFPLHDTPHDYWRFTKYGLRELFKEWEIIELVGETDTFSAIGALLQRVCFQSSMKFNKVSKLVFFSLSFLLNHMNWLITREYGDIKRISKENQIMTTGYYLVAKKK